jgi:hypothetical protein
MKLKILMKEDLKMGKNHIIDATINKLYLTDQRMQKWNRKRHGAHNTGWDAYLSHQLFSVPAFRIFCVPDAVQLYSTKQERQICKLTTPVYCGCIQYIENDGSPEWGGS